MVKIAIGGATSQLARETIDVLSESGKHEVLALSRSDPAKFPNTPGVTWIQTSFEDTAELARLLAGVETVLCYFTVHLDHGSASQKRLIDACIKAGVRRYAPSEWGVGTKLETSLDVLGWYAGKVEVKNYLEELNKDQKVIEYCRFQPGSFLNYLAHPHKTSKYLVTTRLNLDFEKRQALVVEGSLDDVITLTTVQDIAHVTALAVDHEGEWPRIGGIRGSQVTIKELLRTGEAVRGRPFNIDWLKLEDLEAGVLKTDKYPIIDLPSLAPEEVAAFSKTATVGILVSFHRGVWTVSDEWNQRLPEYKFTQAEDFLTKVWVGKE